MKSAFSVLALGLLASGLAPRTAVAATVSASFGVTATVQAACSVSASTMTFRPYAAAAVSATPTPSVTCTNPTPYNVSLSMALGATAATRKMTGSGSAVPGYALSSNSHGTANWGQPVRTDTVAGTGNGSEQTLSVYGRILAGEHAASGAYADVITVTVTY
jgi:spore coat protein U-like protein